MKLIELLDCLDFNQVIIFTKEVKYATKLTEVLNKEQFPAKSVHSKMDMKDRISVYDQFKKA
jgi:superfamily II DNA/RNA helicase